MKKTLALFLTLTMLLSMLPLSFAVAAEEVPTEDAIEESLPAETALPSSFTLKGDIHMPPVDNQGTIGCCVSEAEAFLQFTNAVSRYLHSINPSIDWNPSSGDTGVIFSPKWTYNFSGPGCEWVYTILKHHGAAFMKDCIFYKSPTSNPFGSALSSQAKSRAWDVSGTVMENALKYRLKDYDVVEFSKIGDVTTSRTGKQLLERIKTAITNGNVVAVSGDAYTWAYYSGRVENPGTLGKVGQYAMPFSSTTQGSGGGHCVSLIGYDDNITCTYNGVTLKGAFLMQNSWGTSFCDNGFVWVMYDALNTESEYAALNDSGRCATFGQYGFTDWTKDITVGYPDLMATMDITVADRESFDITLTRTDAEGNTLTYMPQLFVYGNGGIHPFNDSYKNMNFSGTTNGGAITGTFTFSYEELAELEEGKTVSDYIWGFVVNADPGTTVKVSNAKLKTADLVTISSFNTTTTLTGGTFDSTSRAFGFTDGSKKLVIIPDGEHYDVTRSASASSNLVASGSSYSFTITPDAGFTTEYMSVFANGTELEPNVVGEYTISNITEDTYVKVTGVIEDKTGTPADITAYNNAGWEYYDSHYVFVVNVPNSDLDDEIYAKEGEVGGSNYPFYFRLTIDGVSYYTQPVSVYRFDTSTLYRLMIVDAGYKAVNGTVLSSVGVEVICEDHVLYTATIRNTTVTYSASPSKTVYKVTYQLDGETIATDAFPAGSKLVARKLPKRLGFNASWSPVLPEGMPSNNLTVTGSYERYGFVVTWNVNGKVYQGVYQEGTVPVFDGSTDKPTDKQAAYVFKGWSPEIQPITEDVTYTAVYEETPAIYIVTWVVGSGTYTEEYHYGDTPSFKGDTAKESDARFDYTFSGWDKTLRPVTKNMTYTAKYTQVQRDLIGDINNDGTVSIQDVTALLSVLASAEEYRALYDINADGHVSIQDVTNLLSILANS